MFGVVMTFAIITVLIYASFTNFVRAYSIGDSTMDIKLPTWPANGGGQRRGKAPKTVRRRRRSICSEIRQHRA